MVSTTRRLILRLALLFVLIFFQSCFAWGRQSWSICFLCICLFILHAFASSWYQGLAAANHCGPSWTRFFIQFHGIGEKSCAGDP